MKELTKNILQQLNKHNNQSSAVDNNLKKTLYSCLSESIKQSNYKLIAKLYCYENDLEDIPKCEYCCTENVPYKRKMDGFRKFCSFECFSKAMRGNKGKNRAKYATATKQKEYIDCKQDQEENFLQQLFRKDGKLDGNKTSRINPYGHFVQWFFEKHPGLKCRDITIALKNYSSDRKELKTCKSCSTVIENLYYDYCSKKCSNSNSNKIIKTKETNLNKFGVESNLLLDDAKAKSQQNLTVFRNKLKEDCYHNESLNFSMVKELCQTHSISQLAERWGMAYSTVSQLLQYHGVKAKRINSHAELELKEFIESLNEDVTLNDRSIIYPQEVDVVIPNRSLCIEYNGVYYHSFGYDDFKNGMFNKNYHKDKKQKLIELGYSPLFICEFDWLNENKKEILKSMIRHQLQCTDNRIYARDTKVSVIDSKVANKFLEENHIQGSCNSKLKLGLIHNDSLVAVLTVGMPRYNTKYDTEIHRYCTLKNTIVVGGFSKLLSAVKSYGSRNLITYANNDYSVGNLYEACGFSFLYQSSPNYFYYKYERGYGHITLSRYQCQKHKLKNVISNFDPKLTEKENMLSNGYRIYWDSGNNVYEKKIK